MNAIIQAIVWSILPISELRGGIPIAIANGISPLFAFLICVIANILVIPIVFFFLDHIHSFFMKIKIYESLFNKYIEKKRGKLEKYIGTKWEFVVLMLFVGIPLPITGAYTGTLLAWFFNVDRKEAYKALSLGVVVAGVVVSLVVYLGIAAFGLFIKNSF
jgi:uncharacterized membrane protein